MWEEERFVNMKDVVCDGDLYDVQVATFEGDIDDVGGDGEVRRVSRGDINLMVNIIGGWGVFDCIVIE